MSRRRPGSRFTLRVSLLAALGAAGLAAGLLVVPARSGSSTPTLTPDTTFNGGNPVLLDFPEPAGATANGSMGSSAVGRQSTGKVIVAGFHFASSGMQSLADFDVARVNANGTLDTTFGTNGYATIDPVAGNSNLAFGMTIQPDDKIVVVGQAGSGLGVARLTADGAPDNTFGTSGVVADGTKQGGSAVAVDANGNLDVVTFGGTVVRYTPTGTVDTSFGTSGETTSLVTSARALVIQPDGKIVIAGQNSFNPSTAVVARFNADGSVDTGFGTNGVTNITPNGGNESLSSVVLQGTDLLVGGEASGGSNLLARLTSNGVLDPTFGNGGRVIDSSGTGLNALLYVPKPQDVGVGGANTGSTSIKATCRYDAGSGTQLDCHYDDNASPADAVAQTCGATVCTLDIAGQDAGTGRAEVSQEQASDQATSSVSSTTVPPCSQVPLPSECRYDLQVELQSRKTFSAAVVGQTLRFAVYVTNISDSVSSHPIIAENKVEALEFTAPFGFDHLPIAGASPNCIWTDAAHVSCYLRALAPGEYERFEFTISWDQGARAAYNYLVAHHNSTRIVPEAAVNRVDCLYQEKTCDNNDSYSNIYPR